MQDSSNVRPRLREFSKGEVANDPGQPVSVLRHDLSVMDAESVGYDPYDKPPPPPSEAQPDASMRRRRPDK